MNVRSSFAPSKRSRQFAQRSLRWAVVPLTAAVVLTVAGTAAAQYPPPAAAPPPGGVAPTPAPTEPGLSAGGLAPPPPMDTDPGTNGTAGVGTNGSSPLTQQDLDAAKEEDAGRPATWVWLNFEGGFQHVGLQTFNVDEENFTAGFVDSSASGGVIGAGLGARFFLVTLGARGRIGFFGDWQLFSLGGELGFHIPLGKLEPRFNLGAGYTGLGSVDSAVSGASDAISIRGLHVRGGAGLDYFVVPALSVGIAATYEFLALTRPGVSAEDISRIKDNSEDPNQEAAADGLAAEGSGFGSAVAITAGVGLHF